MLEPHVATVETARELARRMTGIAYNLRELIVTNYKVGSHGVVAWLSRWIGGYQVCEKWLKGSKGAGADVRGPAA